MGLPIWRDPEERREKKEAIKLDPTANARSPIRRHPSVHGRQSNRPRVRLPRDPSRLPPRINRSPPPSVGFNGLRSPRRTDHRGVPPISTLLESADGHSPIPPPLPVPEPRTAQLRSLDEQERELRSDSAPLGGRVVRHIQAGLTRMPPRDFSDWDPEARRAWTQRHTFRRSHSPPTVQRSTQTPPQLSFSNSLRRSPEPLLRPDRPHSRDGSRPSRSALPTPPHDVSEDPESLFLPESDNVMRTRTSRHPLSRSWRAESPIDGLGDRNRSPTSADGWEVMQTTITPDATLPSAESSFASAAASHSFTSNETNITEPDPYASSEPSRRTSADETQSVRSESISSVDADDLVCNDEEREATAAFAEDMYFHEQGDPAGGRERVMRHQEAHAREGNRYALQGEPEWVEIGFRLINEALDNEEGRERVFQLSQNRPAPDVQNLEDWIFANRRDHSSRTRRAHIPDDRAPLSPRRAAVREASEQVHDYFRRFSADSLTASVAPNSSTTQQRSRTAPSPPPRYEPLASHPDVDTFTSRDAPEPHPVSPPSARSERDLSDAAFLLSSGEDEQDLGAMRRIVERLAQRDDVPDEWWMSMGLNLSRTRARSRTPPPSRRLEQQQLQQRLGVDGARVRTGRVERGNPRL